LAVRIQEAASLRLNGIYHYTLDRWGADEADRYITDLFAAFDRIEGSGVASRPVPAEIGVDGFYVPQALQLANGCFRWTGSRMTAATDRPRPGTKKAPSWGASSNVEVVLR
jgi:hypothetical protein